MSEKDEALAEAMRLVLADAFETYARIPPGLQRVAAIPCVVSRTELSQAARLLRRLHAENEILTAKIKAREDEILTHSEAVYEATKLLSEEREKNERLRELLTEAAAIEPDCGCVGCSDKREALKVRIDAALRREET